MQVVAINQNIIDGCFSYMVKYKTLTLFQYHHTGLHDKHVDRFFFFKHREGYSKEGSEIKA